jgi:hypothetical protein
MDEHSVSYLEKKEKREKHMYELIISNIEKDEKRERNIYMNHASLWLIIEFFK